MPLNWNFPAKIGPKTGKQVRTARDFDSIFNIGGRPAYFLPFGGCREF
jgi:hypothetical protein